MRSRSERRFLIEKNIKRKRRIVREVFQCNPDTFYRNNGKYNKGKIHCSCGMCKYEKQNKIPKYKDSNKKLEIKRELDKL